MLPLPIFSLKLDEFKVLKVVHYNILHITYYITILGFFPNSRRTFIILELQPKNMYLPSILFRGNGQLIGD